MVCASVLQVTPAVSIADHELSWSFARAGGPGGQNVNKVATKAVLRWDVAASRSVPEEAKARLRARAGRRLTAAGVLILTSQRHRDQEANRRDCLERLGDLVRGALERPKARRASRPTRGSREARLSAKKRRSALKADRRRPAVD